MEGSWKDSSYSLVINNIINMGELRGSVWNAVDETAFLHKKKKKLLKFNIIYIFWIVLMW